MDKINKKIIDLNIFALPVLFSVTGVSFLFGLTAASTFSEKYITLLIGAYVGTVAFIGVVYSKNREQSLKQHEINLQREEAFSENLYEWISLIDKLFIETYNLKKDKKFISIDRFSKEYARCREIMTKTFFHKGRHVTFIKLYKDVIIEDVNKHLLDDLDKYQVMVRNDISSLLDCNTETKTEEYKNKINTNLNKMRETALEIASPSK